MSATSEQRALHICPLVRSMNAPPSAVGTRCSRATIQSGFLTYQVAPAVAVFSRGGQTTRLGVTP